MDVTRYLCLLGAFPGCLYPSCRKTWPFLCKFLSLDLELVSHSVRRRKLAMFYGFFLQAVCFSSGYKCLRTVPPPDLLC